MGPLVVDRYDIEEELLRQQLRVEGHWRRPYRLANDLLNIARWRRYNRGRARAADRVVVCSREDAKRAQSTTAVVIPNGYGSPDVAPAARDVRTPPTFLFQGRMTYDPNVDAASFFARRVLPRLQPRLPGAQLRIVGHCGERVWALDELPDVTVVGFVPTMDEELARADVVVVPIRFGSGTRIKALEAFAHRIPVVSTRRGVEGLDVEDGVHVLIADAPSEFVDACTRVATDGALRAGITERAHDLYTEHYTWAAIRATIGELAAEVASAT
jgi:glycosyltransferase involved in cell wall biosynthesis